MILCDRCGRYVSSAEKTYGETITIMKKVQASLLRTSAIWEQEIVLCEECTTAFYKWLDETASSRKREAEKNLPFTQN